MTQTSTNTGRSIIALLTVGAPLLLAGCSMAERRAANTANPAEGRKNSPAFAGASESAETAETAAESTHQATPPLSARPAVLAAPTPQSERRTPTWIMEAANAALSRPLPTGGYGAPEMVELQQVAPMVGMTDDGLEPLSQVTYANDGSDFDPALSRDGKFMIFASTQHRPTADLYLQPTGSRTITQLTSDAANEVMPAVSPDGARIAFASDRSGVWNLFVMSTRGGQAVQLTNERTADLHPTWSPDGKRLCFSRLGTRSGRWELWVIDVQQPQTAEFIGYGMLPEWCPKAGTGANGADRIAFQRGRERGDRAYSVWTIDYKPGDAGSPTEIVPSADTAAINPTWSPDGQWIAFASVPVIEGRSGAVRPSRGELWITSIDGASRVAVTSGRNLTTSPSWSRDGRLVFVSNRTGQDHVWSVGTQRAIAAAKGEAQPMTATAAPAPHGEAAHPAMAAEHADVPVTTMTPSPSTEATPMSEPGSQPAEIVTAPEPAPSPHH